MNKRNLGNNGTKVFPIGLGGMSFSDAYGETTTHQTHEILSTALDPVSYTHLTLPTSIQV